MIILMMILIINSYSKPLKTAMLLKFRLSCQIHKVNWRRGSNLNKCLSLLDLEKEGPSIKLP